MAECLVSFGSNLGQSRDVIAEAAHRVASLADVSDFRASRLFQTPAVGGPPDQPPFLNAVAAMRTSRPARTILEDLQDIEKSLGRKRVTRWGARTIDLDVVLHGPLIGGATELSLPHPRYTARRFVLLPACDVAPDYCDPRFDWSLQRLANHISTPPASLALIGGDRETRRLLCETAESRFGIRFIREADWASVEESSLGSGERFAGDAFGQGWITDKFSYSERLDPDQATTPRLLARLFHAETKGRRGAGGWVTDNWPAPHRMFQRGRSYPEYHLEISDLEWAVNEIGAAFDSMSCDCTPVTADGSWAIT